MSTEIEAPLTIEPIVIDAPITIEPIEIDAPITIEPIVVDAPITYGGIGPPGPPATVVDDLVSSSPTYALAANQGRVLDDKITSVRTDYGDHTRDFAAQFESMLS